MSRLNSLIGLEIHVQLNSKAKMFSSSKNSMDDVVNSNTSYYDAGLLGTLPRLVNSQALTKALKVCKVLNMEIDPLLSFDRKHYFYSDMAKGYQITQHFHPLGKNGYLKINDKEIKIARLHLEEDSAKQIHNFNYTLIDYNRSGIPLIEIVTEPVFNQASEVVAFLRELRDILLYLKVSECRLEKGSMRVDVNVSLYDENHHYNKVEIKNLNSFVNIEKAIESEVLRETNLLKEGQEIKSYTVRFDEATSNTVIMRDKENQIDYHCFKDPNIPVIKIPDELLREIANSNFKLKHDYRKYYLNNYGFDRDAVEIVLNDIYLNDLFFELLNKSLYPNLTLNLLCNNLLKFKNKYDIYDINVSELCYLIELRAADKILSREVNAIIERMFKESIYNYIDDYLLLDNDKVIEKAITKVLEENKNKLEDYRGGKKKLFGFFMGQVLAQLKGKSNPKVVKELLNNYLNK